MGSTTRRAVQLDSDNNGKGMAAHLAPRLLNALKETKKHISKTYLERQGIEEGRVQSNMKMER